MSYEYVAKKVKGKRIDEHRLVWIQHYGEIPEGYVVHHKDENKRNNDINNLELMTLEEHSKMHNTLGEWRKDNYDTIVEQNRKIMEKRRIVGEEGTAWCAKGEHFAPVEQFTKNKVNWNGLERYCKECRKAYRSKK